MKQRRHVPRGRKRDRHVLPPPRRHRRCDPVTVPRSKREPDALASCGLWNTPVNMACAASKRDRQENLGRERARERGSKGRKRGRKGRSIFFFFSFLRNTLGSFSITLDLDRLPSTLWNGGSHIINTCLRHGWFRKRGVERCFWKLRGKPQFFQITTFASFSWYLLCLFPGAAITSYRELGGL